MGIRVCVFRGQGVVSRIEGTAQFVGFPLHFPSQGNTLVPVNHTHSSPHLSRPCELSLVSEDGPKMFDIFINEPRGSVHWLDSAKDCEEATTKAKKLYAEHPAEYFAFDGYTQTRFVFTLEQLGYKTGQKST